MQSILLCALLMFVLQQDMFDGSLEQNNVVLLPDKNESGYFLRVLDKDPKAEKAKVTVVYLDHRKRGRSRIST